MPDLMKISNVKISSLLFFPQSANSRHQKPIPGHVAANKKHHEAISFKSLLNNSEPVQLMILYDKVQRTWYLHGRKTRDTKNFISMGHLFGCYRTFIHSTRLPDAGILRESTLIHCHSAMAAFAHWCMGKVKGSKVRLYFHHRRRPMSALCQASYHSHTQQPPKAS